jgi:hypothetical protein
MTGIYTAFMRWQALIVLIVIIVSIVSSPSLPQTFAKEGKSVIGILNVCHSATPALSSNGDMPCVTEYSCSHVPTPSVASSESPHSFLTQMLFPNLNEHPPKT